MGKAKDFRFQSSAPSTPAASVASYYVNTSGILNFIDPNGTAYVASTFYPATTAESVVSTGISILGGTASYQVTGIAFGTTGSFVKNVFLGQPTMWIKAFGPNGEMIALPAYSRSS